MPRRGPAGTRSTLDAERLSGVADDVPIGFFEADGHGSLTFVSEQWCEMFSLKADAALGDGWLEAIHPDDAAGVRAALAAAVAHPMPLDETYRVSRRGETLTLRTAMVPVTKGGAVVSFVGATFDVTHFEQIRAIADVMPQLMWIATPDGSIEYFNAPWLEYTGVTLEAMRDGRAKHVVHPDELGPTWELWNTALVTGEPYEIEYRLRNAKTGTYRWFLGRAAPYRSATGEIVRWIGTATDIDTQKRANDNLRFVLDASAALNANLDLSSICSTLANLAIRRVADWCFIVLKDGAGAYRTCAIAHRDSERVRLLERYRERYPVRHGSPMDRAIRRNTPILLPSIGERDLAAVSEDAQHLELLNSLGMRAAMLVPLSTAEGAVYGGIMLVSSESARTYTAADLEVAELVAHHAAAAIHTATAFAQERLRAERSQFLAQTAESLLRSSDLQLMLDDLAQLVVAQMADFAYVMLVENGDSLRTVACAHADPEKANIAAHLRGERMLRPAAQEKAIWSLSQHRTVLQKTVSPDAMPLAVWEYLARHVAALGICSAITVPLFSRGETFGALVVTWCTPGRAYSEEDAAFFTDVGRRVSMAIDQLHTLQRERRIAEALQQALLPQPGMLPIVPGLNFAMHYRPSASEAHVGGDWYDAVCLRDGSILLSVGDVAGRGFAAAGLMGKLRQAIGMAALYEPDPARILDAVDFHLRARRSASLATAFVGIIDPQRESMRYASAGHPPPLLRRRGELTELRSDGLPLGLRDEHREEQQHVVLQNAELLVLYTDGLIEATRDPSFAERRLASLAGSDAIMCVRNAAEFLCDACLPTQAQDDTAVLTVSFGNRPSWAFDAENAQAAHEARTQFIAHLQAHAPADADFGAAELVFGELVGNVVRHAPGSIEVQLDCAGTRPVLHVIDRGRGFVRDPSLPPDVLSESGRGLYIVSRLTEELRVERIAGYGNHIAAVLRL